MTCSRALLLQTALRCKAAGHEPAIAMCHEILDFMSETGRPDRCSCASELLACAEHRAPVQACSSTQTWAAPSC